MFLSVFWPFLSHWFPKEIFPKLLQYRNPLGRCKRPRCPKHGWIGKWLRFPQCIAFRWSFAKCVHKSMDFFLIFPKTFLVKWGPVAIFLEDSLCLSLPADTFPELLVLKFYCGIDKTLLQPKHVNIAVRCFEAAEVAYATAWYTRPKCHTPLQSCLRCCTVYVNICYFLVCSCLILRVCKLCICYWNVIVSTSTACLFQEKALFVERVWTKFSRCVTARDVLHG